VSAFAPIHLTSTIERALQNDHITEPSAIQRAAAEPILAGSSVVLQSGTGTGKTLAYLLPVLQRLNERTTQRAVIVTPSAELSIQVANIARRYKEPDIQVATVVAGGNPRQERLQKSTHLVVGTAGRILELYSERKLKGVTVMVIDEPDPILVGNTPAYLREILSRPEPKVQLIVVGATVGQKTEALIQDVLGEQASRVHVENTPTNTRITHHFVRVDPQAREVALARFLNTLEGERAIVFVNQPQRFRHLYRYLSEHGYRPVTVNGERTKQQRRDALDAFKVGKARVLLVSDAAARGIDIPSVDWVVHYESATSAPGYVHRAGRTGRAGHYGTSVALVTPEELATLKGFARELGIQCTPWKDAAN
jgi:ATP-dependent RNA helicase DeaD